MQKNFLKDVKAPVKVSNVTAFQGAKLLSDYQEMQFVHNRTGELGPISSKTPFSPMIFLVSEEK